MRKIIGFLAAVAIAVLMGISSFYLYKNYQRIKEEKAQEEAPLFQEFLIGVYPPGSGPGFGMLPLYKDTFKTQDQIAIDFRKVKENATIEIVGSDQKGNSWQGPSLNLKMGDNGFCCFSLPTIPGAYEIQVKREGQTIASKTIIVE